MNAARGPFTICYVKVPVLCNGSQMRFTLHLVGIGIRLRARRPSRSCRLVRQLGVVVGVIEGLPCPNTTHGPRRHPRSQVSQVPRCNGGFCQSRRRQLISFSLHDFYPAHNLLPNGFCRNPRSQVAQVAAIFWRFGRRKGFCRLCPEEAAALAFFRVPRIKSRRFGRGGCGQGGHALAKPAVRASATTERCLLLTGTYLGPRPSSTHCRLTPTVNAVNSPCDETECRGNAALSQSVRKVGGTNPERQTKSKCLTVMTLTWTASRWRGERGAGP